MSDHRLLRILSELSSGGDVDPSSARLCDVCASITSSSGAGIMLMSKNGPESSICASGQVSELLDDLQFTLGEGPGIDANRDVRPVLEPDLSNPAAARWPAFSSAAVDAGVRAVFAFPLRLGAARLGALTLYNDRPGGLGHETQADALVMADVAAQAILAMQAGAPLGTLSEDLATGTVLHAVVHQAAGMVAVQLGIPVGEALVRLRASAFGTQRRLTDVARDVVELRLRLDDPASDPDLQ